MSSLVITVLSSSLVMMLVLFDHAHPCIAWVQNTGDQGVPTASWRAVASSSDGKKLAVVENNNDSGGYVWTSSNAGYSWIKYDNDAMKKNWRSIASSEDGSILVTADYNNGYIYRSSDSGGSWSQLSESTGSWSSVAMSADGSVIAAAAYGGHIYIMTEANGPSSTERNSTASSNTWTGIAMSRNGDIIAATLEKTDLNSGFIFVSDDYGVNWDKQNSAGSGVWQAVTISSDGSNIAAVRSDGTITIGTNNNTNSWDFDDVNDVEIASTDSNWTSITSSDDFTTLAVVGYMGYIWMSTSRGDTWVKQTDTGPAQWHGIASNGDGTILVAAESGNIFAHFNCTANSYMSSSGDCKECPPNSYSNGEAYICTCSSGSSGTDGDSLSCNSYAGSDESDDDTNMIIGVVIGSVIAFIIILYLIYHRYLVYVRENRLKNDLNTLLQAKDSTNPMQVDSQMTNDIRMSEKI